MGLITPVVTLNPRVHNAWEEDAVLADLVAIVEAADRLGYHHVTCSEHVAVPATAASARGSRYWDALATLSYLAARTTRIKLATHMLVLGYHHPLEVAKRYGTLDRLSGGRLILGVGVGSLEEEFDLLGADFSGRGPRADDAIRALRASLSTREPSYEGSHFRFRDVVVDPHAVQERVPIWVGGRTRRSLRRALALGDGWVPFRLAEDELRTMLRDVDSGAIDVVLNPEPPFDPQREPQHVGDVMDRYAGIGATMLNVRLVHRSRAHCIEQMEALLAIAG